MSRNAITQGAHHIGLTVPDLVETKRFFIDSLGYLQVGEIADYPAVFLTDGTTMITLWQVVDPAAATAFDRKNVIGLHHLALTVADVETLQSLHDELSQSDNVKVEFAPEALMGGAAQHMMCAIPGGIRVEFISVGV